jgi:hypothetical protein
MNASEAKGAVVLVLVLVALGAPMGACSRHADVRDEAAPEFADLGKPPPVPAEMPSVDGGPESDAALQCAERRVEPACSGPIDLACQPQLLLETLASHCVYESGCHGNGWVRLTMGHEGCIASIAMEEPNDDFAACMVRKLEVVRCPCSGQHVDVFLGLGHEGDAGIACQKPRG